MTQTLEKPIIEFECKACGNNNEYQFLVNYSKKFIVCICCAERRIIED